MSEQIFGWWEDCPISLVVKNLYKLCQQVFIYSQEAPRTSHTSCAKVAILLLQDLSTLCVTDILYMVYIFTCLFSVRNTINHAMNMFNHYNSILFIL